MSTSAITPAAAAGAVSAGRARILRVQVALAFFAIYIIWGSTYLAIRYAVETIPPLLMMGMRHLTAGTLLYAWARWRGVPAPKLREWIYPAVIGTLLFLGGHGSLAWAEQRVPSGIAALMVATLPMWIVVPLSVRPLVLAKPVPVIVTWVPLGPVAGDTEAIVGAGTAP